MFEWGWFQLTFSRMIGCWHSVLFFLQQFRFDNGLARTLLSGNPLFQKIHGNPAQLHPRTLTLTPSILKAFHRPFAGNKKNIPSAFINQFLQKFRLLFVMKNEVNRMAS